MKQRRARSYSSESSRSAETTSHYAIPPRNYSKLKTGLKKANPAALVLWAFHKLPSQKGLTSRRVINFLKRHYRNSKNPRKTGKSLGVILRCAVDFGLIVKRGNRYFLADSLRGE